MVSETYKMVENIEITEEDLQLILHLKANVWELLPQPILTKSEEDQNLYFIRWLRAREHDLNKATEMLRNHLKWRIERNADEALTFELHPFFTENYRYEIGGVDRHGRPVICVPLSEWDFRKVINIPERLAEFDSFVTFMFETIIHKLEYEHGKRASGEPPITQSIFLIDVKDYPYGQLIRFAAVKKMLQFASVYEAHYPEILYKGIFINCPSYFGLFMNLLKPVIAPKTLGKLSLYSSMTKWKAQMGDLVDPDIILERYGGTLKAFER